MLRQCWCDGCENTYFSAGSGRSGPSDRDPCHAGQTRLGHAVLGFCGGRSVAVGRGFAVGAARLGAVVAFEVVVVYPKHGRPAVVFVG